MHRECLGCGYDLWNQPVQGVCSECGRDVQLTLAVPVWAWAEPERARRLARGLRTMAVGVVMAMGLGIATVLSLIIANLGRGSDSLAMMGGLAIMGALLVHVVGLVRASMAAPGAAWLGFGSAAAVVAVCVLMLGVFAHEAHLVRLPVVNNNKYGYTVATLALGQGLLVGLWIALNHTVVSSRRRGEWMLWCGLVGAVLFGGLGLFILAGSSGWFDGRRNQTLMVVFALCAWGITLGTVAWGVWALVQAWRVARRLDVLRMAVPTGGGGWRGSKG